MLDRLKSDIKTSLLAGDRFRVDTLKMAQNALQNMQIEKRRELTEEESVAVVQKEIKRRKEASDMYRSAGATDRAEREMEEIKILEAYVPQLLSGVALSKAVDEFIDANPGLSFAECMQKAISEFGPVDKSQLAGLLKSKLS